MELQPNETPDEFSNDIKAGSGMVLVRSFTPYGAENGNHEYELEIVAWTDASCNGAVYEGQIRGVNGEKKWDQVQLKRLGIAGGLFTAEQWEQAKEAGQPLDFDETAIVGRPIFAVITEEPGTAFYSLKDPRCSDQKSWPRNPALYARWAGKLPSVTVPSGNGGKVAAKPASKPESKSAPSDNPFAN